MSFFFHLHETDVVIQIYQNINNFKFAGQSTQTVTNQQTPSVSSRESTTADFMNIITTVLSPAPVTQGTPSTIPELFSTTSESANTAISTLVTKTSIQAQIGIDHADWVLSFEKQIWCMNLKNKISALYDKTAGKRTSFFHILFF